MGQKTNPIGLRLGIVKSWNSKWFAKHDFPELLKEDLMLRRYVRSRLQRASVSDIGIQRAANRVTIDISTARPGIVIGRRGTEVDKLRDELQHLTKKDIFINIQEIRRPELDAYLVAENIARQLEQRVSFRRAMKKAVTSSMRMGAVGIKVVCAGRLGGAEMARSHTERDGRMPLHTLRADIGYAQLTSFTMYGTIGVKVWICQGEIIESKDVSK